MVGDLEVRKLVDDDVIPDPCGVAGEGEGDPDNAILGRAGTPTRALIRHPRDIAGVHTVEVTVRELIGASS